MIQIRAVPLPFEPGSARSACRFEADREVFSGGSHVCRSLEEARGSRLLEDLFALSGVGQVWIAENTVTVQAHASVEWALLGREIGKVLRAFLEAGAPFLPPPQVASNDPGNLSARIERVLETQINPGVAGHGGKIELVSVEGTRANLRMSGGCQGCGSAKATLKQGVEKILLAQFPEITEVVDLTDHQAGKNPFFRGMATFLAMAGLALGPIAWAGEATRATVLAASDLSLSAAGCPPKKAAASKKKSSLSKKKKTAKSTVPTEIPTDKLFQTTTTPFSPSTKIFLFAGSSRAANFGREIVEQRKLWLSAGFKDSEIACYYVVPFQEDFIEDKDHYYPLRNELSVCYQAYVKLLREHLTIAARSNPAFLYLYVTSHGDRPVSQRIKEIKETDEDYWAVRREMNIPVYDQYHLIVEGLPDGPATDPQILGALRGGMKEEDLFLTPRNLKEMLAKNFAATSKYVVLQGCFSGGFLGESEPRLIQDTLASLEKLVLMTAARYDRSSFGCDPGERMTYFGGAYHDALKKMLADQQSPLSLDWKTLYDRVSKRVTELEKEQKEELPSLPQFVQR